MTWIRSCTRHSLIIFMNIVEAFVCISRRGSSGSAFSTGERGRCRQGGGVTFRAEEYASGGTKCGSSRSWCWSWDMVFTLVLCVMLTELDTSR